MHHSDEDNRHSGSPPDIVHHYDAQYAGFSSQLYADIRSETFDQDLGQNSWLTTPELDLFGNWLQLTAEHHLLDVACGSGGPTIHLARVTGCHVMGIDIHEQGIINAHALAQAHGLAHRVKFQRQDASQRLSFSSDAFEAALCIDAINHLPDRALVFAEWARVFKPGGRLVFTDPIVVTGGLSNREIAIRSSAGFYLFVPRGEDECLLAAAGLKVVATQDLTQGMATVAGRWAAARAKREAALREIEGHATYEGQQELFRVAEQIARERRLSRFVFLASKPN